MYLVDEDHRMEGKYCVLRAIIDDQPVKDEYFLAIHATGKTNDQKSRVRLVLIVIPSMRSQLEL